MNWTLVRRPLERASQLDMRGNPDSCGIWAPCLSYADGLFWLVYTDVKRYDGEFQGRTELHRYVAGRSRANGSDPVYVNSSGFDPSLFHDDDGRKWFVNMQWNHRTESYGGSPKTPAFDGILLQEWDAESRSLTGPISNIFAGSELGLVEGPHLFKRDGWYYLTTAEGGTGYDHAVTMARSSRIDGPYEMHPNTYLITSKDHPEAALQRAGHGQYVETPNGHAYHISPLRPAAGAPSALHAWARDRTAEMRLEGRWLALSLRMVRAFPMSMSLDSTARCRPKCHAGRNMVLTADRLPMDFQWLRTPQPGRIFSLTARPGHLRLFGRESIGSWFEQSLVARRQTHHCFRAETVIEFSPDSYQQVAGLTHYYNRYKFHALAVTLHDTLGRCLTILSCTGDYPDGRLSFPIGSGVAVPDGRVQLSMEVRDNDLQFFWQTEGMGAWQKIGPILDGGVISDEGGRGEHGSFTGAFVGLFGFDISGRGTPADFDWFAYDEL